MLRALRTAATGMKAQQDRVDTIANNIANVNTNGFKKNNLAFRSLLYQTQIAPGAQTIQDQRNTTGLQVGTGVEVSSSMKAHQQGPLEPTGNPLDLGIQGDGFFKILLPNGEFRYTRDGSFRLNANGSLVTVDGFETDPPIAVAEDNLGIIVGQDGTVSQLLAGQSEPQQIGQLLLSRFPNPGGLRAEGANLFTETPSSGLPVDLTAGDSGAGVLRQGFLERSNVEVVEELIDLIQAQRAYEINSRGISVGDQMLQEVGNLVR